MRLSDVLKAIFLFIFSLALSTLVSDENGTIFLSTLPNILGILLGGVLASLAIIFGLLSSQELATIYKRSKEVKNRDIYSDFLRNTRLDTLIIFANLFMSILFSLFCGTDLISLTMNIPQVSLIIPIRIHILFWFGLFGLFLSLSAVYDIILSLFYLNQLRYELSTKIEKDERK